MSIYYPFGSLFFYIFINNKRNIVSAVSRIGYYNNVRAYELKSDNIITLLDTKQKF